MEASLILVNKVKEFEGCRLVVYRCPAGVPTAGYGHADKSMRIGARVTQEQADAWLRSDLRKAAAAVERLNITQRQCRFDALVDFAYNCGVAALERSTLLKKIRACAPDDEVRAEFMKWVHSNGKKLPGLVKRRKWEADRFFGLV